MKYKSVFLIMLFFMALCLSACSSHTAVLSGKYISAFKSEIYYTFSGENYSTNNLWEGINITDNGNGTYVEKDEKIITYINGNEDYQRELGYIYDKYICSLWEGILPIGYMNTSVTNALGDLILTCNFKEDKSYEFTITSNNEIVHTENGTYTVKDNEVACVNEEGITTTFINAEDRVFCVEYVKE